MRFSRSLSRRLMLSHVLVAILTSAVALIALTFMLMPSVAGANNTIFAKIPSIIWWFEMDETEQALINLPHGFTMMLDPDGETVVFVYGDGIACSVGDNLSDCAPALAGLEESTTPVTVDGATHERVIADAVTGHRLIDQRQRIRTNDLLAPFVILSIGLAVLASPVALILARFTAGGLTRRLDQITGTARRFAGGEFTVRVSDRQHDDVGQLAQQFNSMADTLQQNVDILRDLAQRNANLAREAEEAAIEVERLRLSRDLHDSIAQRLFSLNANAATLPGMIERGDADVLVQAQRIATLAEQAQLDLRSMIVDLRPETVKRRGLSGAIDDLCADWQRVNSTQVECAIVLQGRRIPVGVEDAVYRITQEALNNIAKHAGAKQVSVSVLEGANSLTLSVSDDGGGFDYETVNDKSRRAHFGLIGMRERARSVGGTLDVESDLERGTTVRLVVPLADGTEQGGNSS